MQLTTPPDTCGLAAKGLWFYLRDNMEDAGDYGALVIFSKRRGLADVALIAGATGGLEYEIPPLLQELIAANAIALDPKDGAIICTDMQKAQERWNVFRANGRKGGRPPKRRPEVIN